MEIKKAEPAKKEEAKKAEPAKKAPAKKAPAKKAAAAAKVVVEIQYAGNNVTTDAIVAKVQEVAKAAKELNIYYQPENGKVYYTADGVNGEIDF